MGARRGIDIRPSSEGVDWARLKADLAADDFDNGRSPEQLEESCNNSFAVVFAWDSGTCVGMGRLISDGLCNAYMIDVWTASSHRRRGIATEMIAALLQTAPGQHVVLFTEDRADLYEKAGFTEERIGMSQVVGRWLHSQKPTGSGDLG